MGVRKRANVHAAELVYAETLPQSPSGQRDRYGTLARIPCWQVGSRVVGAPVAVPFVNGTRLLVTTGMYGATGNVYVGLMNFAAIVFALHFLWAEDGS